MVSRPFSVSLANIQKIGYGKGGGRENRVVRAKHGIEKGPLILENVRLLNGLNFAKAKQMIEEATKQYSFVFFLMQMMVFR